MTPLPLLTFAAALGAMPVPQTTMVPVPIPIASSPAPVASASPPPGQSPAPPAPAPSVSATPAAAAATPSPAAGATLTPSAYAYRCVPHQPASPAAGEPQIYAVYLNARHLRSHGPILIRVETNPAVVKVESRSNGRGGTIPMTAPGVFTAQSTLPAIPFIASGMTTDLIFIGTSADGRTVTVRVPIEVG